MIRIAIVDYGLGNLRSVYRGIEKAGGSPRIVADKEEITASDAIVLPGVGAFRDGMDQLGELKELIIRQAASVPVLGICLGMQMLLEWSEEHGLHRGLGLVPGMVSRFPRCEGFKVPHMGWNTLELPETPSPLFEGLENGTYVYFVHSYFARTIPEYTLATTGYILPFASAIRNGRVLGVQFHPEKSGAAGLRVLENFISLA